MKNVITVSLLFFASFLSAQTSSFVTDRLRAAEYFRIGINSSQKVTGFNTSISGAGSNEKLPTTKAVVDYLTAGFVPIGYYSEGTGIDITGGVITNTAPDQTVTMTDGTGIDVTGTYPNFTFTNTSPNIVQTLSIAGQDLTLSNGGGTVEIPAGANGALGTGFTSGGGIGTIPNGTVAVSETPEFVFTHDGSQIEMKYETPSGAGLLQYLVNVNNRGVRIRSGDDDAGTSNEFTMDASSGSFSSDGSGSAITFSATNGAVISFDVPGVVGLSINSSDNTLRFTGLGAIMANMDISTRNAMASPQIGQTIFCTDATATDSSTGVMQVYNGSVWKNCW